MKAILRTLLLGAIVGLGLVSTGCKSTDDDISSRPWNSPKGWESGIPSSMTEGR